MDVPEQHASGRNGVTVMLTSPEQETCGRMQEAQPSPGEVALRRVHRPNCAKSSCLASLLGFLAVVLSLVFAPSATASPVFDFDGYSFTLTNGDLVGGTSGTDGSVTSPDGLSIVLTGGNHGTGLAGFTDLVAQAPAAGLVSFQFSFFRPAGNPPAVDFAEYLLGNTAPLPFFALSDTGGSASFNVTAGELFGFSVATDNQGGAPVLTISNFSAPGATAPVPEPNPTLMILILVFAALAARLRIRSRGLETD